MSNFMYNWFIFKLAANGQIIHWFKTFYEEQRHPKTQLRVAEGQTQDGMSLDEDTLRKRILARGFTEEEMRDTLQKCLELNLIMRSGNMVTLVELWLFWSNNSSSSLLLCDWLLLWIIMRLVITMDYYAFGYYNGFA